jgi:hypothetical protein
MAKKNQATEVATRERVSAQFAVLRQALIHVMAGEGERTTDIADALGVNRSYVIRLTSFSMKPTNAGERAALKVARAHEAKLRRLGLGYVFGEGFETTLAGDDGKRGKGGGRPRKTATTSATRAKKAATAPVKASTKAVSKTKTTAPSAKSAKAAKVAKAKATKTAKVEKPVKAKVTKPAKAREGAGAEKLREARATKRASKAKSAASIPTPVSESPPPDMALDSALKGLGVEG